MRNWAMVCFGRWWMNLSWTHAMLSPSQVRGRAWTRPTVANEIQEILHLTRWNAKDFTFKTVESKRFWSRLSKSKTFCIWDWRMQNIWHCAPWVDGELLIRRTACSFPQPTPFDTPTPTACLLPVVIRDPLKCSFAVISKEFVFRTADGKYFALWPTNPKYFQFEVLCACADSCLRVPTRTLKFPTVVLRDWPLCTALAENWLQRNRCPLFHALKVFEHGPCSFKPFLARLHISYH
jgi:hypothetical protein